MDDKDLLFYAAKAGGIICNVSTNGFRHYYDDSMISTGKKKHWNPLENDGDALRLAVKLQLDIDHNPPLDNNQYVRVGRYGIEMERDPLSVFEDFDGDIGRMAATRLAIVRAAAEIGESMTDTRGTLPI